MLLWISLCINPLFSVREKKAPLTHEKRKMQRSANMLCYAMVETHSVILKSIRWNVCSFLSKDGSLLL